MPALIVLALLAVEVPIPLEPGTWWEYRESYTERVGSLASTSDGETRLEVRGSRTRPFLLQTGGFDPASGPVEFGEGWIRLGPWTGEDALPLPLEIGASGPLEPGEREPWRVEAAEEVEVPAGTFHTIRCGLRTPRSVSILWIAPGVGVVKESQGSPGYHPDLERVLLRWHPGAAPPAPGLRGRTGPQGSR